jgi:hypothetical protein
MIRIKENRISIQKSDNEWQQARNIYINEAVTLSPEANVVLIGDSGVN